MKLENSAKVNIAGMTAEEFSIANNLARDVKAMFNEATLIASNSDITLRGNINLSHSNIKTTLKANCEFIFSGNCLKKLPEVKCFDKWVKRKGADWHASPDGWLCYELPQNWKDFLNKVISETDRSFAINFAALWCVNSTKSLLYKHHFAWQEGIEEWPQSWDYWGHGQEGVNEYYKQRRIEHGK